MPMSNFTRVLDLIEIKTLIKLIKIFKHVNMMVNIALVRLDLDSYIVLSGIMIFHRFECLKHAVEKDWRHCLRRILILLNSPDLRGFQFHLV